MSRIKLSEFISEYGDGIHGTPKYSKGGDYYFVNGNNLDNGSIVIDENTLKIDSNEYEKIKRPLTDRTVLLSINGSLGNTAFYKGEKIALGKSACYLNIKEDYSKEFFRYILTTREFQKYMLQVAHGSTIKNFAPSQVGDYEIDLPDKKNHEIIAKTLTNIDSAIVNNNKISAELEYLAKTIYDYWFLQFEFPNSEGKPYKSSGGKMVYNEELKREIPEGWHVANLMNNSLCSTIKPGVDYFDKKNYLPTANVNGEDVVDGDYVTFDNRESRANMQPSLNSVWFAKLKNSIKHITLPKNAKWFTDKYILSTGMEGLQCNNDSLAYIHCLIYSEYFERHKDILSHGATQEGVNDEDLKNIKLVIPDDVTLKLFAEKINPLLEMKMNILKENQQLSSLRDWLLPMLMNGQVTFKDKE